VLIFFARLTAGNSNSKAPSDFGSSVMVRPPDSCLRRIAAAVNSGRSQRTKAKTLKRFSEVLPRYIGAAATIGLGIFAYMAWNESTRTTAALQGQLDAMQLDQRPLLWVINVGNPAYDDTTGQVFLSWFGGNIGKGIAYNVVFDQYIKLGNERYQPGRSHGANAIELTQSQPLILPPNLQYNATVLSRPGIKKDFYTQSINTDFDMGILIDFSYSDASGKNRYTTAVCTERLVTGAFVNKPPQDCMK